MFTPKCKALEWMFLLNLQLINRNKMTILNVSFGIYAFLPKGWVFMISIIIIECISLSYLLTNKWFDMIAYKTVFFSNLISGIVGIIGSILLNGGWWLVVWFPWVSDHEVKGIEAVRWLILFYAIAFVLTLLIEGLFNYLFLKKKYSNSLILKSTLIINMISYLLGSFAMYSYSF